MDIIKLWKIEDLDAAYELCAVKMYGEKRKKYFYTAMKYMDFKDQGCTHKKISELFKVSPSAVFSSVQNLRRNVRLLHTKEPDFFDGAPNYIKDIIPLTVRESAYRQSAEKLINEMAG